MVRSFLCVPALREKEVLFNIVSRSSTNAVANVSRSSSSDEGPTPETVIGIEFVKQEISKQEVSYPENS
jgi:hypothetical protein